MSVIVPISRREYVQRPSVSLFPLPAQAADAPILAQAAREAGIDPAAVEWGGGITLVAPLSTGAGLSATVHARPDTPDDISALYLFAPGIPRAHVASGQFAPGQKAEVPLHLRGASAYSIGAVARHRDGRLSGVLAELQVIS
jgi:hypothetical protein